MATFEQLLQGKSTFRMAFLGGSITEGAGAYDVKNRYSSRLTAAVARRHPQVQVEEINAGVGGTASVLGMCRMNRDVMEKDPDILFVEFAVNDFGLDGCGRYMEGIVRNALRQKRNLPIVFLYSFSVGQYEIHLAGERTSSMEEHHRVAQAYGIPEIDLAAELAHKIRYYGGDASLFIRDTVHPNDDGHAVYADVIMSHLYDLEFDLSFPVLPVSGVEYAAPHMELLDGITADGFALSDISLYDRTPHYLYASQPGSSLTFSFEGSLVGGYIAIEKDSGDVAVEVDGVYLHDVSTWDSYALRFNRSAFVLFAEGMPVGHHTLRLTVLPTKQEKSEGTFFRIGAFLIG